MKNIQRPNYFTSQFLVEEDFKDEQAYHRDMRLRHNRLLHEWGVVEGLEVTRAGDKKIAVSEGMAIDKDGQEIIVLPNCTVPDTINTINLDGLPLKATIEITVMYREIKDKGYRVGSEIKYTRTTERPKFVIYGSNTSQDNLQDGNVDLKNADSPPPEDNVILLAQVKLDNDGKVSEVHNYVRKLAGAKLSTADGFRVRYDHNFFGASGDALVIEQRDINPTKPDRGIAFVNTGDDGVVETALVIKGNGNVGIGTNNPSQKLEVAGTVKATNLNLTGDSTIDGSLTVAGSLEVQGDVIARDTEHMPGNVSLGNGDNDQVTIAGVIRSGHSSGALRVDDALHTTGALTVDGNVGIGTTSIHNPQDWHKVLDILGSQHARLNVRSGGGVVTSVFSNDSWNGARGVIGTESNHPLTFATNYQHRMTIDPNGNVGIGTTNPQSLLQVGDGLGGGNRPWMTRGLQVAWDTDHLFLGLKDQGADRKDSVLAWGDNTNDVFRFIFAATGGAADGQEIMRLQPNGNVGIGTNNPSEKLEVAGTVKATKFEGAGNSTIDGSLTVNGLLEVKGNVSLGDADNDQVTIAGVIRSGDSSAALRVDDALHTTGALTVDGNLSVRDAIATAQLSVTDRVTGSLTIENNLTVGGVLASTLEVSGALKLGTTGTQIFHSTNESGTPSGDGFRLRYDNNFFGTSQDALVIEKTDGNHPNPDGGIAFVNTGNDGVEETALVIKGNGNVGISTNNPSEKLEVAGTVKATKFEGAGDSTIDGSLTVNGLLEVKGNVSLGDADNDEVKVTGVIRSGHSSGALRVDDALHTTGALTVDGNVGIGTTNPSEKLEVAGTVKATHFEGDGSALTGISAGKWSDGGSNRIYYNAGHVGIGTNNPTEKLEVDGAVKAKSLTIEDNLTVNGNITTSGMIRGSSMPPNLIRNSYMNILDGNKPAGYNTLGNLTLEAAHPFTKGFEGPYVGTKPANAADSVDDATEENPYWFGISNKGSRIKRGGLADGWASFRDGRILKITGDNSGQHTMILFPFESRGNFLTKKYVHLKAWLKISSGKQVGFGELAGWGNGKPNSGLIITKEQSDNAPDGWYRVDGVIPTSEVTKLGGQSFSMGIAGDDADGSFEVYLALPYLANLDNDSWLPSVSDLLSRDGLTVHPTSGNVGIGTTNPSTKLEVDGTVQATRFEGDGSGLTGISAGGTKWSDGSSNKIYYNAGNVGIGTNNPQSLLQVGDGLGGGNRPWMTRGLQVAWNSDTVFLGLKDEGADRKDSVLAWGDNTNDAFRFIFAASGGAADGQEIMRLQPNGNVGIGTTNPSEKLEVAGTVKATKFEGDSSVGNAELANNSVTNAKIANDAVNAAKIQNGTVGTAELANNSVTNAKIANNSISMDKLDAVTRRELNNASELQSLQTQIRSIQGRIANIERLLGGIGEPPVGRDFPVADPDPDPRPGTDPGPSPNPEIRDPNSP
ncbi:MULTISPECIES: hypothetical protein [Moorena]|uniref:Uncharacterized protein n=1 Tax=Moorena producens 3L TaxID=489825 RepID=F4XIV8_9CYAN|nr:MULTISPECIES: hypothetical protein [Moorena]EGJ35415.1 hypothetical protein LYNGBM3L_03890 [Moorena producens 3L]NEP68637.1 hypothetical protein [Moorena sp. SIO3A5]NER90411.1 hypothetical protein [Moorena sp. SIO3A2]OLT64895.1 hypothetical protein BI334_07495 [Moorena producens 3L]